MRVVWLTHVISERCIRSLAEDLTVQGLDDDLSSGTRKYHFRKGFWFYRN